MANPSPDRKETMPSPRSGKLGLISGVYIPVCLNVISILMFLRFGLILGQLGLAGIFALLIIAYCIDLLTVLSLSAVASNGEVKGGGTYYLISRSLGPEFGGPMGILFFLAQALNASMNVAGLIDCIRLQVGPSFPSGYWTGYLLQTAALTLCTGLCLLGSVTFSKASNTLLAILSLSILSIPLSAILKSPFRDEYSGIQFTGLSWHTLAANILPRTSAGTQVGLETFRRLFGILFPATSGILAGASMSGDLKNPSKAIPQGTLWATLTTLAVYLLVVLSMAASTTRDSLLANANVISLTNLSPPVILAGECAVTLFSALMGIFGSAKLLQALAKDRLLPGLSVFGRGTEKNDEPILAIGLTYAIAQVAMLADLNQIATFISMGYQMTFFVMNLACFLLKIASAPNFRPIFRFFSWQTAFIGSLSSAAAMFFIDETYATVAICFLIFLFLIIHYLCPPKKWGDVSQNLIYHQVRKYLLRLKPEHIKFWRPHIILLINDPRRQVRLIQFCNSLKKGSLYILGHVIVTDDFDSGVHEARLQQQAWTRYISEYSRIKAFVQLAMSPSITWGIRNLILSAGLGGMRPNIAVLGFYDMDGLRRSHPDLSRPNIFTSRASPHKRPSGNEGKVAQRKRGDTSARLLEGVLPTDVIRTESMMSPTDYMLVLEDVALKYRLNVAVAHGFSKLNTPQREGQNAKKYIDLWPIQMSAELSTDGMNVLTTNFDTYTLILQLGHILRSVPTWGRVYSLRVMLFVEYETEVGEEIGRVKALLEKLRIDAEVRVFWLASGQLETYEHIVNGCSTSSASQAMVAEILKDEDWWADLQAFRGRASGSRPGQNLPRFAQIRDPTAGGRASVWSGNEEVHPDQRRQSVADIAEMSKKPDIGILSKLGVSLGIRTHHLHRDVFQGSSSVETSDSDSESFGEEEDYTHAERSLSFRGSDGERQPLAGNATDGPLHGSSFKRIGRQRQTNSAAKMTKSTMRSYGTIAASQRLPSRTVGPVDPPAPDIARIDASPPAHNNDPLKRHELESFPNWAPPEVSQLQPITPKRSRSMSPIRIPANHIARDGTMTPMRPTMSRQSSAARFSSRPVPEMTITAEAEGSKISFVVPDTGLTSRTKPEQLLSSGPGADTTTTEDQEASTILRTEENIQSMHSRHESGQQPGFGHDGVDCRAFDLAEFRNKDTTDNGGLGSGGSGYSTQSIPLSFNDLPSRAQHLIVNELIRDKSNDTAVLMSTLPIPSEGTSSDKTKTIQYLSDIEVLCTGLPPILMVLSNSMTVTVNL